ncbi:MAG TPA: RNA polymerase factor sigma-54 [Burkholderiaceae bacterium]|nr:RNA polymerase factor sigma-54 [Burkholderiaceae bacterium]HQR71166.1 RNA polymerase factor sigma-54 [Burkholderiaceae bacterium]
MKPSLQLRLSQHLALTPQLQQSIRLLQLSTLELNQEIEQAMADNPLLERDDDPLAGSLYLRADGAIERPATAPAGDSQVSDSTAGDANSSEAGPDTESADGTPDMTLDWGRSGEARTDEDDTNAIDWASTRPTLREHLRSQLACTQAVVRDRALVDLLIEALDEDGYLQQSFDELLALLPDGAEVDADELRAALRLLQSFDPPGVGARDTAECLRLQLDALARNDRAYPGAGLARRLVSEHLPLLAARDFLKLKRALGCTDDELRAAHQLIRTLNPRPGVAFGETRADYVVPDVFVRRIKGRWTAVLNQEVMPRLRVNQAYADILKRGRRDRSADPAQRGQWTTRVQEARWLIRNIQQRFDTILRVSQAIVDRQHNFFTHGEIAMRPLVLREIADTVELHESTISRVTANKYMATPFGVFELKHFFGSHVATEAGGAASSTAIRALIKQLIGAEDTRNPLSDSKLAEMLGEQGIVVARRTVAKYREAMKIPAVAMRRSL